MDIVVKGRNVEVPDHYRQHVAEKLAKFEKYDQKLIGVDVELFHEPNRRQHGNCQRVEITVMTRGPVVRAEACAADFYAALDAALSKVVARLRRVADRRRVHRGRHTPTSVAEATAPLPPVSTSESMADLFAPAHRGVAVLDTETESYDLEEQLPGQVVREKEHSGEPMSIEDALFQMELVGHDFYLFHDKESDRPSVVYRRRGYDYGVIRLTS